MHYLRLVNIIAETIVSRQHCTTADREAAAQEGSIGLMDAVEKYNPQKSKFPTYARYRIRGAIVDYMRREIPGGRLLNSRKIAHQKQKNSWAAQIGEEANVLMEKELWASPRAFEEKSMCAGLSKTLSLSTPISISNHHYAIKPLVLLDLLPSEHHGFEDVDRDDWWKDLCKSLPTYHNFAIQARYKAGLNMKEIGRSIGYSEGRISQILSLHNIILQDFNQISILATDSRITDREKGKDRSELNSRKFNLALAICS